MVERFRAVRQFFHEEGELVTYEDYKALADKLDLAQTFAAEMIQQRNAAQSRLPRWRIAATEKPTADGEYIVAWRRPSGGWGMRFDYFSVEDGEFADYDAAPAEVWMPYPEFPQIGVVERQTHEYEHTCTLTPDVPCAACGYLDRAERL